MNQGQDARKRWVGFLAAISLGVGAAHGQAFTGTNAPGASRDFNFTVSSGTTNLSLTMAGGAASFSQLFLRAGVAPTPTQFDFAAVALGTSNVINLELPDLKVTNYVVRVFTPTNSLQHAFTLTRSNNVAGLRSASRPATKSVPGTATGAVSLGTWHYYRLDLASPLTGWRATISSATSQYPELYLQKDRLPTTSDWLKRSQGATNDVIILTGDAMPPGVYYVGVYAPSSVSQPANYSLSLQQIAFTQLPWDPGLAHLGTLVYRAPTNAGDYYFRVVTQNSKYGVWRSALTVDSGQADLYLNRSEPPTPVVSQFKSELSGSDGFVLPETQFEPGEDWFFWVHVQTNSVWSLVTGDAYVADLGLVEAGPGGDSGPVTIGAEGMRFFRTQVPGDAIGWQLGLRGLTNTILLRKTAAPHLTLSDLKQDGQMLVVPPYLIGGLLYFVGVTGTPGTTINLHSRLHFVTDINFVDTISGVATNYPYVTYRVQVPEDQLDWQVSVTPLSGNPNVALRREFVPNELNNDGFSEVGGTTTDSITLVPFGLSDGTFFVTVYGTNAHTFSLTTGPASIRDIAFTSQSTNSDTNRAGWQFYRLANISEQLGSLGWEVLITNQSPGTQLALRRNAVPGYWYFRAPGTQSKGYYDFLSTNAFIQRPGHPADVWYVGVYNPSNALGNYTLITRALTAEPVGFDGGNSVREGVASGKWQFFQVDVPTNALGWDVRLTEVTSGKPQLVVRRDRLPESLLSVGFGSPIALTNWATGNQWAAADDWTAKDFSELGIDETGRILAMGINRPLVAGRYYLGVFNAASNPDPMNYTVRSRGIGPGMSLGVTPIAFGGGSATNTALPVREAAYYRVTVPTNAPSWRVWLELKAGQAALAVGRGTPPNITARINGSVTNLASAGRSMNRVGNEHLLLLPPSASSGETNLVPGDYYLVVASEGQSTTNVANHVGSGSCSYVLHSLGTLPVLDLGVLTTTDIVTSGSMEGGDVVAYEFRNEPDALGFEIFIEQPTGRPWAVSGDTEELSDPGTQNCSQPVDNYGNEGGECGLPSADRIIAGYAFPHETIMVKARGNGTDYPDATYQLRIHKHVPTVVAFDGGQGNALATISQHSFFRVDVPPDALGWELRLVGVSEDNPRIKVGREYLPVFDTTTLGWIPQSDHEWIPGFQWAPIKDWTQRSYTIDGTVMDGRIFAVGMGRPLEPGTYYVGVRSSVPCDAGDCYQIESRGIGPGYSIPVVDLPFSGGSFTNQALAPREAAYFQVVVTNDVPSWKVRLRVTSGEATLLVLTNNVPNIATGRGAGSGKVMQKSGQEHFVLLPSPGQVALVRGTNFLAVVGEGLNPTNSNTTGGGVSVFILESQGQLPVEDLGVVGTTTIVRTNTLEAGEVRAYRFRLTNAVLSVESRLLNRSGNPVLVMRQGVEIPDPGQSSVASPVGGVSQDEYGNQLGALVVRGSGEANLSTVTLANPLVGEYTIVVKARPTTSGVFTNASYQLTVRAIDAALIDFDGGSQVVVQQPSGTWRYFRVEVPPEALGWDFRLVDVSSGLPRMAIARDQTPFSMQTTPWAVPGTSTNWLTTNQWAITSDWTRRGTSADGLTSEDGRVFAAGMGLPLEPGIYYIGVINTQGTDTMSYRVQSRGIGEGYTIPVTDLAFTNGVVAFTNLVPREASYYRVQVPEDSASWKLRLTMNTGEGMCVVVKDAIPNIDTGRFTGRGKSMQKPGNEHYVLLPPGSVPTNLTGGTYYVAVVSEGVNPASSSRIGGQEVSGSIESIGVLPVMYLGTITEEGVGVASLMDGGDTAAYRFDVPEGVAALELRLDDRVGNPVMVLRSDEVLPAPGGSSPNPGDGVIVEPFSYGYEGGGTVMRGGGTIVTISNPTNGLYSLVVKARSTGATIPDAAYTLSVRALSAPVLNFSAEYNGNGYSNVAGGLLRDNHRAYYRVDVPELNPDGTPVLGWALQLEQISGLALVRVAHDRLPLDQTTGVTAFTTDEALIVPPFLTNGTWYVEVRGSNTTEYTITSKPVRLERPTWVMPGSGEPIQTPGLIAPEFGDTGTDTNGLPIAAPGSVELAQGYHHFYAVQVPQNNAGLLRVTLETLSGNPDLYVRYDAVATATHRVDGAGGTIIDRSMIGGTRTEYRNWVPLDGTRETILTPGRWYFTVRAAGTANASYRLRLSTGSITPLDWQSGGLTDQLVAGMDWRYYRVDLPFQAPTNWFVTFSQLSGDVVLHLRDECPPGNDASSTNSFIDWVDDRKHGVGVTSYDAPGTYTFSIPPVRPGGHYYLGLRGTTDARFSISSSGAGTIPTLPQLLDFYTGTLSTSLPPGGVTSFRVIAPAEASRWRHLSSHSNVVQVFLRNGNLPSQTAADDWRSLSANSSFSQLLSRWPWLPDQVYFGVATNTSTTSTQNFSFTMQGLSVEQDDPDGDGMPDLWEMVNFGSTTGQAPGGDYDQDGVSNLDEFREGTDPGNAASLRPRLTVVATNGTVTLQPNLTNYAYGTAVRLTPVPDPGYEFSSWSGDIESEQNPLNLVLNENRMVVGNFRVPGDDFRQRIVLVGPVVSVLGTNLNATKEAGEPLHAGDSGGASIWWTWRAPQSGAVSITVGGTAHAPTLAVYTGYTVTNLTWIASDIDSGGPRTCRLEFNAEGGTDYQFAVDGVQGVQGTVSLTLNLDLSGLLSLQSPGLAPSGAFQWTVVSPTPRTVTIQISSDLVNWTDLRTVSVNGGSTVVVETEPVSARSLRYYRAIGN